VDLPGKRTLAVSTRLRGQDLILKVEDSGPGVPSGVLPHIFEPFFTTKEVGSGTGLGLSIAHSILAEHGGRIYYEKSGRGGACFVIEIPVVAAPQEVEAPAEAVDAEAAPSLAAEEDKTGFRILVIDDEQVLAELLAELLAALGHEAVTCCSPLRALELVESREFDLILSDFRMPIMNGRELYERINQTHPDLARRMVFLTGDVVTPETRGFIESTGNAHLAKPFRLDGVAKVVSDTMKRSGVCV
jgi:two-component system NtrC family sensor kinase